VGIIDKVSDLSNELIKEDVTPINPFGMESYFVDSDVKDDEHPIRVTCSHGRITYTNLNTLTDKFNIIDKYKVAVIRLNPDRGGNSTSKTFAVLGKPMIIPKGEACSTTYLIVNTFDTVDEAQNFVSFLSTKLIRFLVLITLSGNSITSGNFSFVPNVSFNESYDDEKLNKMYGLTDSEINYIDTLIREKNIEEYLEED
ncbi:MAG: hypothetical protein IJ593_01560, partial [Lachnospiraceae bacterium]|nr:hypothetical protein [Lachnospiraceae bacterium]